MPQHSVTAALIVAAGRGVRAGGPVPKQYAMVAGRPVLAHTVAAFTAHPEIDCVLCVVGPDDGPAYSAAMGDGGPKLLPPATGGASRQASVLQGLRALAALKPDVVLIHDAVRPFVTPELISACIAATSGAAGAVAAMPMADTVKVADAAGRVVETLDRSRLWRAQTPQAFRFAAILAAHEAAAAEGVSSLTDDAAVAERAGLDVTLVTGHAGNWKITTPEDLAMAETALAGGAPSTPPPLADLRVGQGYDIHRLVPGDHVWLCGVRIPHTATLEGHSDADVGLHALTDALLATIADADIGEHFRNTDPRWRGAASHVFLADAARRVRAKGGSILNVDVTLLSEAPKISPHRDAMRARIAEVLGIATERVSVKATTNEGLGSIGRREGIAALASATVILR
ncbi:MAG: bifunctional 2-C-methyl-D-erythritol 4-phosphate cytidylyltransferase/2-C-methyl-D-erythritol 2,4-cyclodiphosphate synthase [Hyphomicrobiaceae bacterium]|nr:bifunctional 2-C-methyl-D-erythritol 4-phosphate cytidylyltransferase/2-C-methyl-D-erythritol 2,4-cyclodiphosphate synthase [Hyphomicrobiaceae bacterium]